MSTVKWEVGDGRGISQKLINVKTWPTGVEALKKFFRFFLATVVGFF